MEDESTGQRLLVSTLDALRHSLGTAAPGDRIVAAMSGGVDSSVMAALLHHAGYQVVGVSMHLFDKSHQASLQGTSAARCCTLDDFQDARRVAYELGFPHYVMDFEEEFRSKVVDEFVGGYLRGETPSPCILCNQHLKFKFLTTKARELGANFVATGHYARIQLDGRGYHLLKAKDLQKDQSYYLFNHTQETLAQTLFPLADLDKQQVRSLGRALGLHLSEKPESQEICFVGSNRYDEYIESQGWDPKVGQGQILHIRDGQVMGTHDGYWRFTVGQRKGLRVAHASPLYVIRTDPGTNTVWVGDDADLLRTKLVARFINWCAHPESNRFRCKAKIRSRSPEALAQVEILEDERVSIEFLEPQRAITPGQAVVLYEDNEVLGGGWIAHVD